MVGGQLGGRLLGERREQPTGLDLGELCRVADQDDRRGRLPHAAHQLLEVSRADHACFVHDQDASVGHGLLADGLAVLEEARHPGDGPRADARPLLQLLGGRRREAGAEHRRPVVRPDGPGGFQRRGLAGPGRAYDHLQARRPARQSPDHVGLVRAQGPTREHGLDQGRCRAWSRRGPQLTSGGDGSLFEVEVLLGRPPSLPTRGWRVDGDDGRRAEQVVDVPLHVRDAPGAGRQPDGDGLECVVPGERRGVLGEALGPEETVGDLRPIELPRRTGTRRGEVARDQLIGIDADGLHLCSPPLPQLRGATGAVLRRPCVEAGSLSGSASAHTARLHRVLDLGRSLGEQPVDPVVVPVQLSDTSLRREPRQPETFCELGPQRGLIEVAGGLRVTVERPAVQR